MSLAVGGKGGGSFSVGEKVGKEGEMSKIKLKMMEFLGLINKFNLENQVRFIREDSEYSNQNNLHFQSL